MNGEDTQGGEHVLEEQGNTKAYSSVQMAERG